MGGRGEGARVVKGGINVMDPTVYSTVKKIPPRRYRRSFREIVKYSRVSAAPAAGGGDCTLEARLLRVKRGLGGASEFCKTHLAIYTSLSLSNSPSYLPTTYLPSFLPSCVSRRRNSPFSLRDVTLRLSLYRITDETAERRMTTMVWCLVSRVSTVEFPRF